MKPLAIDLYCGLESGEMKVFRRADATIKKLVASRAKNPDHMGFGVRHNPPRAISLVPWLMCYFKYPTFPAGLARYREIRIFSPQAPNHRVLEGPACIVQFRFFWMSAHPQFSEIASRIPAAIFRAISLIGAWRRDIEVVAALGAVPSGFSDVALLTPSAASNAGLATIGAVSLIWPLGCENLSAIGAR